MTIRILVIILAVGLAGCSKSQEAPIIQAISYEKCNRWTGNCYEISEQVETYLIKRIGNKCQYAVPDLGKSFWDNCE